MKRLLLVGMAISAFTVMPTLSASALPGAKPEALVMGAGALADADGAVILAKRGGRGHHFGWGRGRGHHFGWGRGRGRG